MTDLLQTRWGDVASLVLFGSAGALIETRLWPLPSDILVAAGVAVAVLGLVGCAIERGIERPIAPLEGLGLSGVAALCYAATLGISARGPLTALGLAARLGPLLALGFAATRLGPRLDRGEAGWRIQLRSSPPDGASPFADRVAGFQAPGPLRWVELAALPLSWILRVPCLAAILAYQLSASRLMPPPAGSSPRARATVMASSCAMAACAGACSRPGV